jgi:hypothetical protein
VNWLFLRKNRFGLRSSLRQQNFESLPFQNDQSDCFSNFSYTNWREVTKFENNEQPRVRQIISIDFQMI